MNNHKVKSYWELTGLLDEMLIDNIGKQKGILLFRGQIQDYGNLRPTAARKETIYSQFLYEWVMAFKYLIHYSNISDILRAKGVDMQANEFEIIQILLQHYGSCSRIIDLTRNLNIALWFAYHKARILPLFPLPRKEITLVERGFYQYIPQKDNPIIYVFVQTSNDCHSGDGKYAYIDLCKMFPVKNTRIKVQESYGLYFNVMGEIDGIDIAEAKIELDFDYEDIPEKARYSTKTLFPNHIQDSLLKIILSIPYVGSASQFDIMHRLVDVSLFFGWEMNETEIVNYLEDMNNEISIVPLLHFPFRRYINLYIEDNDPFPILPLSENEFYPLDSASVIKIHSPMRHINEVIERDKGKYLNESSKIQNMYKKFVPVYGRNSKSVFFEMSDLDLIQYAEAIKPTKTPLCLVGVWGHCKGNKISLRGLYVRHNNEGYSQFGLSLASLWNIEGYRSDWYIEKYYDCQNGKLEEINPELTNEEEKNRALKYLNFWSASIILAMNGALKPFMPIFEYAGIAYKETRKLTDQVKGAKSKVYYPDYIFLRLEECLSQIHMLKI